MYSGLTNASQIHRFILPFEESKDVQIANILEID